MRKTYSILVCLFFIGFVSCDNEKKDVIWDYVNTTILVTVQDEQGHDLLNPECESNILGEGLKVVYQDKEYPLDAELGQPEALPRYNMPIWNGFSTCEPDGKHYVAFGEFSPTDNYRGEMFVIDWGDGTTDRIVFDHYVGKNDTDVVLKITLNGQETGEVEIMNGQRLAKILVVK